MSDLANRDKDMLIDPSAYDEYFNLKQRLCLTEKERFNFTYYILPKMKRNIIRAAKLQNIKFLIEEVNRYKKKYRVTLDFISDCTGIHRVVLSRILLFQVKPQPKTVEKLQAFMEDYA